MRTHSMILLTCLLSCLFTGTAHTQWAQTNGPYGGDVHCLAVSGTNLFAGTLVGVFLSTNNGTSWTAASTGLTNTNVSSFAVSGTNLFAGTLVGVFLSTNNGTSWTAASTGLTNPRVFSLAVSGTNLFAGTRFGGVFLSTNNGTSWRAASSGLTNTYVQALAVSGTNLFAGTWGGGIFLSTNNGTSWAAVSTSLTNTNVSSLAVIGTNLFAGTEGGRVWRRPLSEMITSVEVLSTNQPAQFSLSQNYPNPFNPVTTISYQIKEQGLVQIKVYNLLGQEIVTFVNEEQPSGIYETLFDASNFPSGVYIYSLRVNDFVQNNKMTLLK